MQKLVVTLAITLAIALFPVVGMAGNQQVAEYIAKELGNKFPAYSIQVKYNSGVATLAGEVGSEQQVSDAIQYVSDMPGVVRVINNIKVAKQTIEPVQMMGDPNSIGRYGIRENAAVAPMPTATAPTPAASIQAIASAAVVHENQATPLVSASGIKTPNNSIAQVSGQVTPVTDFSQMTPPAPRLTTEVPAPTTTPKSAPLPTANPVMPVAATVQMTPHDDYHPVAAPVPTSISTTTMPLQPRPDVSISTYGVDANAPLPMGQQSPTQGRYDQPNVPPYAWPAYAAPNNYAEVTYPRMYCPQSYPNIGPFYPYPQVPLGWRKVTLEWHDGWWWLDFDDGTTNGPFSPLFRQPNRTRF